MTAVWEQYVQQIPNKLWLALGLVVLGSVLAYLVGKVNRRLLQRAGVPSAIEGTSFERTAQSFGTSTVSIIARLSMYFVLGLTVLVALTVAESRYTERFWSGAAEFLPQLFIALLVLIVGVVVGDKVELVISERLRGIKLPEVGVIPLIAKYSVMFIAVLVALGQVGVATGALLILLAVYVFGLVFVCGLALRDLLPSAAAGIYLLLNQPYGIGDEIRIGDRSGVVQEVDVFVTRVESDGEEYIVPNRRVFTEVVARVR